VSNRAVRRFGEAAFSPARVWAMLLRYLYILRSSWPRTIEHILYVDAYLGPYLIRESTDGE